MNKFDVMKILSKSPIALGSPAQEILKLAILIAATCLASKVEEIIREIIESDKISAADVIEEIKIKREEI